MGERETLLFKAILSCLPSLLNNTRRLNHHMAISNQEFGLNRTQAFDAFTKYIELQKETFNHPNFNAVTVAGEELDNIDIMEQKFYEIALPVMMDDQHILAGRHTHKANIISHEKMWAMIGRSMTKHLFYKVTSRKKGRRKKSGGSNSLDVIRAREIFALKRVLHGTYENLLPFTNKEIASLLLPPPNKALKQPDKKNLRDFRKRLGINKAMDLNRLQNSISNGKKFLTEHEKAKTSADQLKQVR